LNQQCQIAAMHAIIVLGCSLILDEHRWEYIPGEMLKMRLDAAIQAYIKFYTNKLIIIVSGRSGSGNDYAVDDTGKAINEASVMKEYLVQKGVPAEVIFEEGISRNTIENCIYSLKLVAELELDLTVQKNSDSEEFVSVGPIEKLYIVTSDFHMPRSEKIFRHFTRSGLEINCVSATSPTNIREAAFRNEALINIDKWICAYSL